MAGSVRLALVLLVVGTALAGCTAKSDSTEDPLAGITVTATPTTGVVRGVVVDSAIRPVTDAQLAMKVGDKILHTNSSASGAFGYEGIPAGTYFIDATKVGYTSTRVGVEVKAGVSEPPVTKIALAENPSMKPYVETYVFKGFLECGVTTPAVSAAVCFALNDQADNFSSDNTQIRYSLAPNNHWVQSEMVWQATNPAGQSLSLSHSYNCPGQTLLCNHNARGPSPLLLANNATWIKTLGLNNGTQLYIRVFSSELEGTRPPGENCVPNPALGGQSCPGGAGLALQQDFTIYTHAFHGFVPPEGYRFSRDGSPAVPAS